MCVVTQQNKGSIKCYLSMYKIKVSDNTTTERYQFLVMLPSLWWNPPCLNSNAGESPKRKNTTFRTWWKFEIENIYISLYCYVTMQNQKNQVWLDNIKEHQFSIMLPWMWFRGTCTVLYFCMHSSACVRRELQGSNVCQRLE